MPDLLERLKAALAARYAGESEIGRGGMATVFLAEDKKHRRQVAIKVLHPELAASIGADRFLHEIEIVAGLSHPHILPLHDSGEADGLLYYVMPFVEGESLRQRLEREGQLAVDEAVKIAVEVADGLDYAHRSGVVHRDVKPGNILFVDRHAVLADFGISRAINSAGHGITSTGLGVGTPLYASPEQVTGQETLDGRTDIYSLGCVLYEMLAGQPPLTGSSPQAIQARRLTETPAPLHTIRETVPPALDQVIARSLRSIPADRYATAKQFGQALRRALATPPRDPSETPSLTAAPTPAATPVSVTGPGSIPEHERRRWSRRLLFLVVPIAIVVWFAVQYAAPGMNSGATAGGNLGVQPVQLTDFGSVASAVISPDGEQLAYCVTADDGGSRLLLARFDDPNATRTLVVAENCVWLRWGYDESEVFFRGAIQGHWGTYRVSTQNGSVKRASCRGPSALAPDGNRCASGWMNSKVIRIRDQLGKRHSITIAGEFVWLSGIDWSPVDDRLALQTQAEGGGSTLWTIRVDGSSQEALVEEARIQSFRWSPDGKAIVYARQSLTGVDLVRVPVSSRGSADGQPKLLLSLDDASGLSFSGNGRKLVLTRTKRRSRIVRIGAAALSETTDSLLPVNEWGDAIFSFKLSNDGHSIAYTQSSAAGWDLFRIPVEGGSPQRITSNGGVRTAAWSPDDRVFAYVAPWQDTLRLWLVSSAGGKPAMIHGETVAETRSVAWRPGYLLFQTPGNRNFKLLDSLYVSSVPRIGWIAVDDAGAVDWRVVASVQGRGRMLLNNERVGWAFSPWPSPDGKLVLLHWNRSPMMDWWVVGVGDSIQTRLSDIQKLPSAISVLVGWSEDSQAIFWRDAGSVVHRRPLNGGDETLVMSFPEGTGSLGSANRDRRPKSSSSSARKTRPNLTLGSSTTSTR